MCIASLSLGQVPQAAVGSEVQVIKPTTGHAKGQKAFGQKARRGSGYITACVCVPYGAVVKVVGLPGSIQARLGIRATEIQARMVSYDEARDHFWTNRDDIFEAVSATGEIKRFRLEELPVGTMMKIESIEADPAYMLNKALDIGAAMPAQPVPVAATKQTRERITA